MKNTSQEQTEANGSLLSRLKVYAATSRNLWIAVGAIGIVVFSFAVFSSGGTKKESTWAPVRKGTFVIDLIESGDIRAVNSYQVQAPMEWRMELQITDMVKEGTHVKEGDYLAQFDTNVLQDLLATANDQLKAQEAEVLSSKTKQESQMSQFESDLKMAEYSREAAKLQLELLRFESEIRKEDSRLAYEKALISYDETQTKIRTQKIINDAEMRQVMQSLRHEQGDVKELKQRIENLTLHAPVSGMVVYNEVGGWRGTPKHKVAIGETVWPNMTVIIIPDLTRMESVIRVNEIDASKLEVGQTVFLRLEAFVDRMFQGRLYSIAPLADKANSETETQIKDYEVIVRIDESDQILKPGMSARTRVVLEEIPDTIFVPIGAVFERNGEPVVFTRKSYPNPVPVTLGKRSNQYIMITNSVTERDEIALTPPITDVYPLGWFAEMERRASEKDELLGHLDTMDENGVANRVVAQAKNRKKELPENIKQIVDMLEKAGQPLTAEQKEKLLTVKPEDDIKGIMELLNETQRTTLRNLRGSSGGQSERGGGRGLQQGPGGTGGTR